MKEMEAKAKQTILGFTFHDYQEVKANYCNKKEK